MIKIVIQQSDTAQLPIRDCNLKKKVTYMYLRISIMRMRLHLKDRNSTSKNFGAYNSSSVTMHTIFIIFKGVGSVLGYFILFP